MPRKDFFKEYFFVDYNYVVIQSHYYVSPVSKKLNKQLIIWFTIKYEFWICLKDQQLIEKNQNYLVHRSGWLCCYVARLVVSSIREVALSDLGSIPSQGEIMNVPVVPQITLVLWALLSNDLVMLVGPPFRLRIAVLSVGD